MPIMGIPKAQRGAAVERGQLRICTRRCSADGGPAREAEGGFSAGNCDWRSVRCLTGAEPPEELDVETSIEKAASEVQSTGWRKVCEVRGGAGRPSESERTGVGEVVKGVEREDRESRVREKEEARIGYIEARHRKADRSSGSCAVVGRGSGDCPRDENGGGRVAG
jgi:hypothetical protein